MRKIFIFIFILSIVGCGKVRGKSGLSVPDSGLIGLPVSAEDISVGSDASGYTNVYSFSIEDEKDFHSWVFRVSEKPASGPKTGCFQVTFYDYSSDKLSDKTVSSGVMYWWVESDSDRSETFVLDISSMRAYYVSTRR